MFMDPDVVLDVEKVSKKFSHTLRSSLKYGAQDLLRHALGISVNSSGLREGEFWALQDISLKLKRGESLGLLGLNGAGKSTLLKLINGIYLPDEGEVRLLGKVGALIELSAGFHPMLTGKENIYIKGALMGLSQKEIDAIYDEIVEFADLGEFIDSPIKTYSSGMYARLGFSVAVHIDPDILLVDEVLSVGDFKFRQKCLDKVNEMRKRMSVIFVSHNMRDITLFCDRAFVLDKGKVSFAGKPDEAVKFYLEEVEDKEKKQKKPERSEEGAVKSFCGPLFHNENKIVDVVHNWVDSSGNIAESVKHGSSITLDFSFRLLYSPKNLVVGIPIWDKGGNYITAINTDVAGVKVKPDRKGIVRGRLSIDNVIFNSGEYISVIAIVDGMEFLYRQLLDKFSVKDMPRQFGFVTMNNVSWHFEQ